MLRYNSVCVWWDINLWIVFQVYNECVLVFLFNILLFPPTSEWFHPPPHRRSLWQHQRGHTSAEQRSCCGLHGTGECRLPSAGWEWYYSIETMRVSHFNMWYTGCITLKLDRHMRYISNVIIRWCYIHNCIDCNGYILVLLSSFHATFFCFTKMNIVKLNSCS